MVPDLHHPQPAQTLPLRSPSGKPKITHCLHGTIQHHGNFAQLPMANPQRGMVPDLHHPQPAQTLPPRSPSDKPKITHCLHGTIQHQGNFLNSPWLILRQAASPRFNSSAPGAPDRSIPLNSRHVFHTRGVGPGLEVPLRRSLTVYSLRVNSSDSSVSRLFSGSQCLRRISAQHGSGGIPIPPVCDLQGRRSTYWINRIPRSPDVIAVFLITYI